MLANHTYISVEIIMNEPMKLVERAKKTFKYYKFGG